MSASRAGTLLVWLGVLSVAGCGGTVPAGAPVPPGEAAADTTAEAAPPAPIPAPEAASRTDTLPWAERTLAGMTLREKVGQMMMPWVIGDYAPDGTSSRERIVGLVRDQEIGGVIMSVGSPTEIAAKLNDLQRLSKLPLLVGADLETGPGFRMSGTVHMPGTILLGGATEFPSLMALGATWDPDLAYRMGTITAVEARAVGIHVPFAPVLDVNNNPSNPIINVRSFGESPGEVGEMGAAFVRGVQDHGAVATGKHFPGHGDTETDSHLALPVIHASRARLDSVELRPFRDAVAAGIGGIMTAHISVPALNGGTRDPATLSHAVLTDLLRDRMDFQGLIFTDAMDMAAIAGRLGSGESAVRAVEAGADVILMPASVERAEQGILEAVSSGRIPESRIDSSVVRLLRAKQTLGLDRQRTVSLDDIPKVVGIPEHTHVADEIARRSITVVKNDHDLIPLSGTRSARVLSISYRRPSDVLAGRWFNQRLRETYPSLITADVDRDTPASTYDGLLRQARRSALVVVGLYVTAVSYSGTVAIPKEAADFIKKLAALGGLNVVVSFGNPYLISEFPRVQSYVLAWSGSQASQSAAAGALLGDFDVVGRTPTRIPGFAEIGDGILIPRKGSGRGHE
jgi:beta-N-acetylhexosaminidase